MAIIQISFGNKIVKNGHVEQYNTVDNELGDIFAWQIRHLQTVPFDSIESYYPSKPKHTWNDLLELIPKISETFGVTFDFDINRSIKSTNLLHEVYENIQTSLISTGKINGKENLDLIYKFHACIHDNEKNTKLYDHWKISWGYKEDLVTKQKVLHEYYTYPKKTNCLCSAWSELGKTPFTYFEDQEPNDQNRINELVKPHINFRPSFLLYTESTTDDFFPIEFTEWWKTYSSDWCKKWNVGDYSINHKYGCLVLAEPVSKKYEVDWQNEYPLITDIKVL